MRKIFRGVRKFFRGVRKILGIWHKLSIHLGFSENRMGVKNLSGLNRAQILHPPTAMLQIRWYGKASLCTNSPSTYGYATNPMVWNKLPCAQTLHLPTAMPQIRWYGKASLCSNSPSTYSYTNNSMGPLARRTQMSSILTEKEANPMEPKAKSAKMGSIHFGV